MGASHAQLLAEEGATVILADRNVEAGKLVADSLVQKGLKATFVELDVTDDKAWKAVADKIRVDHGRLDVFVQNAGILASLASAEETTDAEWEKTIAVNQSSIFLGTRAVMPLVKLGRNPSVVNVSSIFGLVGAPGYFACGFAVLP